LTIILAVDGGNSKTDVARVTDDGEVLGLVRGPQCSPDHLGLDASIDLLGGLIEEAGGGGDVAVLLLAGLDFPDEEDAYRAKAEQRGWAATTIVGNDTFAVLRAGTDRAWGVAVTCGAGINCVGIAPDGRHVRFASLGAWSGDWGGGRDVGLAAVYAAARSEDRRGPRTALEQLVPAQFGLRTPTELARALLAGRVDASELVALAPLVLEHADGDSVAGEIVDRLAAEIVTMARTALVRLRLTHEDVEVVLGGGLLQSRNARLLNAVEEGLHAVGPRITVRVSSSPPIVGAVLRGLDEVGASPRAHERLRAELSAQKQTPRTANGPRA
jgi:N-acetylglucosamine kinase-like BadF-type ATPase